MIALDSVDLQRTMSKMPKNNLNPKGRKANKQKKAENRKKTPTNQRKATSQPPVETCGSNEVHLFIDSFFVLLYGEFFPTFRQWEDENLEPPKLDVGFKHYYLFSPIWGTDAIWLTFFEYFETTN